jgi:hypothetical protein
MHLKYALRVQEHQQPEHAEARAGAPFEARFSVSGVRLVLVRGPREVQRVFELTATDRRLEMVDSPPVLDQALEPQP